MSLVPKKWINLLVWLTVKRKPVLPSLKAWWPLLLSQTTCTWQKINHDSQNGEPGWSSRAKRIKAQTAPEVTTVFHLHRVSAGNHILDRFLWPLAFYLLDSFTSTKVGPSRRRKRWTFGINFSNREGKNFVNFLSQILGAWILNLNKLSRD